MKNKLLLGFIYLILVLATIIGATAIKDTYGNDCSVTPEDYQMYNDSTRSGLTGNIDVVDDYPSSGSAWTVFIENFQFTNLGADLPQLSPFDATAVDYINNFNFNSAGSGIMRVKNDSGANYDLGPGTINTPLNITWAYDRNIDKFNTTFEQLTNKTTRLNFYVQNDLDFDVISVSLSSGSYGFSGVYIWNGSGACPSAPAVYPVIDLNSPADNHHSNQVLSVDYNVSHANGYNTNITLYINGDFNTSSLNVADGTRANITSVGMTEDGNYTWILEGCDILGLCTNTSSRTFVYDTTNPTITWTLPFANNTSYFLNNFTSSISLSDTNLYSYYFNITQFDGTVLLNYSNTSISGINPVTISEFLNLQGYEGALKAEINVCDAHTNNEISFGASKLNSELRFNGVNIYLEQKTDTQSYDYQRTTDRYRFNFQTKTSGLMKSFIVESNNFIDILDGTGYKGHLVTNNRWIDFEGSNVKGVTVERISDTKVRVIVTSYFLSSTWNFESIGELNCVQESKEFFIYNATETHSEPVTTTATDLFVLTIDYNASFMNSIVASLVYNGTEYAPTRTNNSEQQVLFSRNLTVPSLLVTDNVSFYWNYTIDGTSTILNSQQQVTVPDIDDCSVYTVPFVNYTLINESSLDNVTGNIDYVFTFNTGTFSGSYNGSEGPDTSFDFCQNDPNINFSTDVLIQYSATGFDTRDYIATGFDVDGVIDFINLSLLDSSESTAISIHVIDDSDNDLEGVIIEAYRYNIDADADILAETAVTDSQGDVQFNLETGDVYYSFKFYQNGDLKLTTTRFRLFATSYEYTLSDVSVSRLSDWVAISDAITRSITYDNSTGEVEFTWAYGGSLVDQFCFIVSDSNATTEYYNACSTNTTGSLIYVTSSNISYLALGQATTTHGFTFTIAQKYIDLRDGWRQFGTDGLILSLIVFLVTSLIMLINKNIAVVGGTLALCILIAFGLIPLGKGYIIPIIALCLIILFVMNRRPS